ncbi:MAG: FAD:protein FMN transferase [Eubacteriales bacterium]|jgi:thiamine biosynthesis lipoprotein
MKRIAALAICCLLLAHTGCASQQPMTQTILALDTVIQVTYYDAQDEQAVQESLQLCQEWEALLSKTIEGSDIYRINHAQGKAVEIDPITYQLIEQANYYSQLCGGAFDITIGSVTALWDFHQEENAVLPDPDQLAQALTLVDYQQIHLYQAGERYYCQVPAGVQLDLGAIAKGYIADQMGAYLQQQEVENAVLDLGGNIQTVGDKNGDGYRIGVKSPSDPTQVIATLDVSGANVVTSGVYERYIEVDGQRYHHILNTHTGYPVENHVASVTILSSDGASADALSTACFTLGEADGLSLLESLPYAEGIFIMDEGQIITTSGISQYNFTVLENE